MIGLNKLNNKRLITCQIITDLFTDRSVDVDSGVATVELAPHQDFCARIE
jgi:hypothetical protein